jgi:hypothetical protein
VKELVLHSAGPTAPSDVAMEEDVRRTPEMSAKHKEKPTQESHTESRTGV